MSARKDDAGKPPISLIPRSAILATARVMASGAKKYGRQNWRSNGGLDWSRVIDAAMRHMLAFADGEDYDNGEGGSGELHLANAICCLAFLIEYHEKGLGTDDRFRPAEQEPASTEPFMFEPTTVYKVVVTGSLSGTSVVLGTFLSQGEADAFRLMCAPDWPTYDIMVEEEHSARHSETA
jgi:hypothetical protein